MKVLRSRLVDELRSRLREYPVVALIGMRQSGKTTLARDVVESRTGPTHFFDLEDDRHLARLREPIAALEPLRGLVVLDEIQHLPGVFRSLRVLADRPGTPCRFLVLGSASGGLLGQTAESLAGRIAYVQVRGLALDEVGPARLDRLWLRGGLPSSLLARNDASSFAWRQNYVRTFLERDVPQLGIGIPAATLRRFWTMLAHWHGQIWNGSEFGSSFGVSHTTVRRYLDALTEALVVTSLQPWHENLKKRQVKTPKVYLADSGLLHALLQIETRDALLSHPKVGASWEGTMLAQSIDRLGAEPEECFFWSTHGGAELDLLVVRGRQRVGVEVKHTSAPVPTANMRIALQDLKLDRLHVVHAGKDSFPMGDRLTAIAAIRLLEDMAPLR
jgi:hypothetical protein